LIANNLNNIQHFNIEIDGRIYPAKQGDTVAAVLISAGIFTMRRSLNGSARGLYCGMGVCFECRVTIDNSSDQRACVTNASPGMRIQTESTHETTDARN
jgi:predicted molibdopterin-dependent oxidoreductase YjgC